MQSFRVVWMGAAVVAVCLASCEQKPPPSFEVVIKVLGDRDRPIKDAEVLHDGTKVGISNADGVAGLRLKGAEGETFYFSVQCPQGFDSPAKPMAVTLRRVVDSSKRPEYTANCTPSTRTVVVAIRADNGPNLPVMYLGREVARTDAAGAAHVLLQMPPSDTFQLKLDTTEKGNERLKPQNPVASFANKQQDDIFTFDQKFTAEKKVVKYRGGPTGPTKLTH